MVIILVRKPQGQKPCRRHGCRYDNIKMNLGYVAKGQTGFNWLRMWTCGGLL
jgi:hypothetical protein